MMGLIMHEPYIHASGSQFPGSRSSFPRAFFSISTLLIAFISLFFYSLSSLGRRRGSQLEEMTEIYAYFIREILKGCAAKCLDRTNSYTNDNGVIGVSCDSWIIHAPRTRPFLCSPPEWLSTGGSTLRVARKGRTWLNNGWKKGGLEFYGAERLRVCTCDVVGGHLWFATIHESSALYSFESWTFFFFFFFG